MGVNAPPYGKCTAARTRGVRANRMECPYLRRPRSYASIGRKRKCLHPSRKSDIAIVEELCALTLHQVTGAFLSSATLFAIFVRLHIVKLFQPCSARPPLEMFKCLTLVCVVITLNTRSSLFRSATTRSIPKPCRYAGLGLPTDGDASARSALYGCSTKCDAMS